MHRSAARPQTDALTNDLVLGAEAQPPVKPSARPLFPTAGESRTEYVDSEAAAIDHAVLRSIETGIGRPPAPPPASVVGPAATPELGPDPRPDRPPSMWGAIEPPADDAGSDVKVVVGRLESHPEASGLELAFDPSQMEPRRLRRGPRESFIRDGSFTRNVLITAGVVIAGLIIWSFLFRG